MTGTDEHEMGAGPGRAFRPVRNSGHDDHDDPESGSLFKKAPLDLKNDIRTKSMVLITNLTSRTLYNTQVFVPRKTNIRSRTLYTRIKNSSIPSQ